MRKNRNKRSAPILHLPTAVKRGHTAAQAFNGDARKARRAHLIGKGLGARKLSNALNQILIGPRIACHQPASGGMTRNE